MGRVVLRRCACVVSWVRSSVMRSSCVVRMSMRIGALVVRASVRIVVPCKCVVRLWRAVCVSSCRIRIVRLRRASVLGASCVSRRASAYALRVPSCRRSCVVLSSCERVRACTGDALAVCVCRMSVRRVVCVSCASCRMRVRRRMRVVSVCVSYACASSCALVANAVCARRVVVVSPASLVVPFA